MGTSLNIIETSRFAYPIAGLKPVTPATSLTAQKSYDRFVLINDDDITSVEETNVAPYTSALGALAALNVPEETVDEHGVTYNEAVQKYQAALSLGQVA